MQASANTLSLHALMYKHALMHESMHASLVFYKHALMHPCSSPGYKTRLDKYLQLSPLPKQTEREREREREK